MSDTSTSDLAARLYERWRQGMEFYKPDQDEVKNWDILGNLSVVDYAYKPRPVWRHLDTVQQNVWRAVAIEASQVLSGVPA